MNQAIIAAVMEYLVLLEEREKIEARFQTADLSRFETGTTSRDVDSHGRRLRRLWLVAWILDQEIDAVLSVTINYDHGQWLMEVNSEPLVLDQPQLQHVVEWLNIYSYLATNAHMST